eukprot:2964411-Prorocentrum_lima.AAC.1
MCEDTNGEVAVHSEHMLAAMPLQQFNAAKEYVSIKFAAVDIGVKLAVFKTVGSTGLMHLEDRVWITRCIEKDTATPPW